MSTPIGIWSLVVPPQTADMFFTPEADVCITSAALGGEELVGSKRALLSLTHVSLDDGSEDEFDSDDYEEDSDEDDEDDDEDEEMEPVSTASKKSSASAKSSASKKSSKSEDDEEDEDEDDEDDEEDDEPALQTVTLAALTPGKIEHVSVNVTVNARTTVMFTNNSENEIHLIGNYVINGHDHDDEDDFSDEDVDDSEEEGSDLEDLINDDESDEDAVPAGHIEEVEMAGKLGAHIGKAEKRKALEDALAQETQAAKADLAPAPDSTMSKKAKKALKKQRTESGEAVVTSEAADSAKSSNGAKKAAAAATAPAKGQAVKKQTLPSGIIVEDMTIGTGPIAKNGNNIKMRYIGKLTSGKVFDKNVSGPPFKFKLGTGEVIKGWDLGIAGMQVGGERKLTIPAELAYGKQSVGGIPKNSTLVFEVKMLGC